MEYSFVDVKCVQLFIPCCLLCYGIGLILLHTFTAQDHVTRWIVDQNYRKEQDRLKIPYGELLHGT